ncbi:MAG: hypothetical protein RR214_01720, partial [Synergistaceae bacterium]
DFLVLSERDVLAVVTK